MNRVTRRDFIKSSLAASATMVLGGCVSPAPYSRVRGANGDIRVAVVGVGDKGGVGKDVNSHTHCRDFSKIDGVRVVAVCDADQARVDSSVETLKQMGQTVKGYQDYRKLLGDKNIDAIIIATPNHWHALMAVSACQAGKDVYVEKPASHEIWEGRKIVEAARKYKHIVQVGTQRRSSEAFQNGFEYINQGNIGKILWVRGLCYKERYRDKDESGKDKGGIIRETNGPNPVPASVDYNLWCGPAEMEPLRRPELHYYWHWVWNTGNGDIGNQGAHEMDEARWSLGQKGLAPRVISIGGRFAFHDAGETANTQIAFFDYKPAPLIFEVHNLPRSKTINARDIYRGIDIGVVVQCEDGYFAVGEAGGWIYDNNGNKIKQFAGDGGKGHQANFIKAVRSRKTSDLNADIEKGHISAALCHMGNISYRLGKKMPVEEIKNAIADKAELMDSFQRMLDHLAANEVNLENEPITIGPMLTMNTQKEEFVGEFSSLANMYLKRNYREPFVVPDKV
jgi:predicted dehydrogenase